MVQLTVSMRFRYVDVAVANAINKAIGRKVARVVSSYDINCKYSVNFRYRVCESDIILVEGLPEGYIVWLVPKFHLGGHIPTCADKFSFNYTVNVGCMSGELVETPWAAFNWLQYSTREMGWGSRRDLLNHHLNHWNWGKITKMGEQNIYSG